MNRRARTGVMYSFGFPLTESQEGFADRRLPTGELGSSWTRDYPPTDEGQEKAIAKC